MVQPVVAEGFIITAQAEAADAVVTSAEAVRVRAADEDVIHHVLLIADVGDVHRLVDVSEVAMAIDDAVS
jgi:hypothetical protein